MMGSSACGLLLVLALMAPMGLAIKCYECNKIPGDFNKPCPGGGLIDFGSNHDVSTDTPTFVTMYRVQQHWSVSPPTSPSRRVSVHIFPLMNIW